MMSALMPVAYALFICFPATQALHAPSEAMKMADDPLLTLRVEDTLDPSYHPIPPGEVTLPVEDPSDTSLPSPPGEENVLPWILPPEPKDVYRILPKTGDMCIEGTQEYITQVLDHLLDSNMDVGWTESKITEGTCADLDYTMTASGLLPPDQWLKEEQCFPDASVFMDGKHPGFYEMDQKFVDQHNSNGFRDRGGNRVWPRIECMPKSGPTTTLGDFGPPMPPPKQCLVTDWSAWGACGAEASPSGDAARRRSRTVSQDPDGGMPCPHLQEFDYTACGSVVPKDYLKQIGEVVDTYALEGATDSHEACVEWSQNKEWGALSHKDGNRGKLVKSCDTPFGREKCAKVCELWLR